MATATTQPHAEKRSKPGLPIDLEIMFLGNETGVKKGYVRKPNVAVDYKVFSLNGKYDEVKRYTKEIGAVQVKSSSPETHEELYMKSPGFIGIHPSLNLVSLSGIEKKIVAGYEKILGEQK